MRLGTKPAIIMMLAVVLWTAVPLIACVPGLGGHSKHDCCTAMTMADCGGDSMACATCCQLEPQPASAVFVSASLPNHGQEALEPVWETLLQPMSGPEFGQQDFHQAPPPDPSPGGLSVLRI